jgi:hypothetical protein
MRVSRRKPQRAVKYVIFIPKGLELQTSPSPAGSAATRPTIATSKISVYMNALGLSSAHVFTLRDHEALACV